jgi:hypothetical protein
VGENDVVLPPGPLFHNNAQVVQLLDGGFYIAADFGAVLGCSGGLFDGDDAAVTPCRGRDGGDGLGQVRRAQLEFLAAGCGGAEHGSLADGAGVGIGQGDAQGDHIRTHGEEGINPRRGLVDIDIHALGGQGNKGKPSALAVELGGRGLGLLFGLDGGLGHSDYGLFFLVAGGGGKGEKQSRHGQNSPQYPGSRTFNHRKRISGTASLQEIREL